MRAYTGREKAEALCLLRANGGNVKRTARELGLPRKTVCTWAKGKGITQEVRRLSEDPEIRGDLAGRFERIAVAALESVTKEKLEKAGFKDTMIGAGIAVEKAQLLRGQPTAIHKQAAETLEEAASRLLEKFARKGITISLEQAREKILELKPEYRQLVGG